MIWVSVDKQISHPGVFVCWCLFVFCFVLSFVESHIWYVMDSFAFNHTKFSIMGGGGGGGKI